MTELNLAYPERSHIQFTISKFPDGQQQIVIQDDGWEDDIQIKSRLNNFLDLELIICARRALRNSGYLGNVHLYVPYFLGSRSDRHFGGCTTHYLRDVICPIINSLNFSTVTVLDPHSDVLEACLNNFVKEDNHKLIVFATNDLYIKDINGPIGSRSVYNPNFILVSPDAGANKKVHSIAEGIGYKGEIVTCSKSRDNEGKLTKVVVSEANDWSDKDLIIIDDICDGGATFINITKVCKREGYRGKIYLIVTHGIFSKGFGELIQCFDGIYTTNSYADFAKCPVIESSITDWCPQIKQLNIF